MDLGDTMFVLLLLLFAAFWVWISSFCLGKQRNWVALCKEFANSRGLIYDPNSVDTSIRFFGNYAGFCFKMEVDLIGGWEAVPPELNLCITITGVGQVGDSFKITKAHFLSRKRIGFGNPEMDRDYVISGFSGKNYGNLFTTRSFCESILKYQTNVLSLAKQELAFSKRVTEKQLEELWGYSSFLLHIGKQINRLIDIGNVESEQGVCDDFNIEHTMETSRGKNSLRSG